MPSVRTATDKNRIASNKSAREADDDISTGNSDERRTKDAGLSSSMDFLAHQQLHEVLFSYLEPEDVLRYRTIHSECNKVVLHYARTQLRDVVGQDLSESTPGAEDFEVIHRRIASSFVKLLTTCGEDIGQLLASAPGGVRTLGEALISIRSPSSPARALNSLLGSLTEELLKELLHIDLCYVGKLSSERILPMLAQHASKLRSLSLNYASEEMMKLVAANCPVLESFTIWFPMLKITDDALTALAQQGHLRLLALLRTGEDITDKSMAVVATNCLELRALRLYCAPRITDASISLVGTYCLRLRSLTLHGTKGSPIDP